MTCGQCSGALDEADGTQHTVMACIAAADRCAGHCPAVGASSCPTSMRHDATTLALWRTRTDCAVGPWNAVPQCPGACEDRRCHACMEPSPTPSGPPPLPQPTVSSAFMLQYHHLAYRATFASGRKFLGRLKCCTPASTAVCLCECSTRSAAHEVLLRRASSAYSLAGRVQRTTGRGCSLILVQASQHSVHIRPLCHFVLRACLAHSTLCSEALYKCCTVFNRDCQATLVNTTEEQNSQWQAQQWTACRRALGVVRSSTYTQPSAAKSSAASRAILCTHLCVVVQAWMASNSLKHSGRERAPGAQRCVNLLC